MMDPENSPVGKRPRAARWARRKREKTHLELSQNAEPKRVFIQVQPDGSPGFATFKEGPYFNDLSWKPQKDQPFDLFITFELLDDILAVVARDDQPLYCSAPFEGDRKQLLAVPNEAGEYTFRVMIGEVPIDPKIVITPQ